MGKPTGKMGIFHTYFDNSRKLCGEFKQIQLPQTKGEIEIFFVSRFLKDGRRTYREYFLLANPQKNPLDDFDFTIQTPNGSAYLELMEVAPLELYKGGYGDAPSSYDQYELAQIIFLKILKKSRKYPKNLTAKLYLLLYVTDWKFRLNDTTVELLSYFCMKKQLRFEVIFLYTLLDSSEGIVNWIHPIEKDRFKDFDPEQYRGVVINLDPQKFVMEKVKKQQHL